MLRFSIIAAMLLLSTACGTANRLFEGEIYRVDTPWYDSREDFRDEKDLCEPAIDIATYCFATPGAAAVTTEAAPQSKKKDCTRPAVHKCADGGEPAYQQAQTSAKARDRLQDLLIAASDQECDKHLASLVATQAGTNLGLSIFNSLLSGAATGFTATSTKTVLAAAATLVSSSRAQLNEQVYRQLFIDVIVKAINDDREAQYLELKDRQRFPVPNKILDPRDWGEPISDELAGDDSSSVAAAVASASSSPPVAGAAGSANGDGATAPAEAADADQDEPADTDTPAVTIPKKSVQRHFYSIDEAIRDAAVYHSRCSFYSGLVRLKTKVEEFSPCRLTRERRDHLLVTLAALKAPGANSNSAFTDTIAAYESELTALNTKLAACLPN